MADLSVSEYAALVREFLPTVGVKADFFTSIHTEVHRKHLFGASLYPHGITNSQRGYLSVDGDSVGELWEKMQTAWREHSERHRIELTRKMALAIIRITTELGECTDAALREEFNQAEIKMYGLEACNEANAMAGRGPFNIVLRGGENGAPELDVA